MPQFLGRRDDQAGGVVVMEGATARQVLAGFLQRNARRLDQTLNRDLNFQPLDFGIGDARHGGSFFQSLPECLMGYLSKTGLKINNPAAVCYSR